MNSASVLSVTPQVVVSQQSASKRLEDALKQPTTSLEEALRKAFGDKVAVEETNVLLGKNAPLLKIKLCVESNDLDREKMAEIIRSHVPKFQAAVKPLNIQLSPGYNLVTQEKQCTPNFSSVFSDGFDRNA